MTAGPQRGFGPDFDVVRQSQLLPINFRNSANGTGPRPWIGAIVATFSFRRWMLANKLTAFGGAGEGGGVFGGPGLYASASTRIFGPGRNATSNSSLCKSPCVEYTSMLCLP